ncbi:unnamed protein product [Paramecium primaurelia]|uniref:WD domain, G-beta repeat protein n=1 Tax=Paramecium primaurelia TaxID=5886 RepID=A0A8S1PRF0_PARPR|nr:unnamed protein product [Paramecium primaurelia]
MSFCPEHQQKVVFYGSAFSELKNRKLCQKCIVNMNKNLMLIEDLEKQFSLVKLQFMREIQTKRNKNLEVLHSIKIYLQKQRNQISDVMNIAITYIDTQVELIKKVKEESQETLQISNNEDFQTFSKLICQETSIYKNIQVSLLQYIKKVNYTQLQNESEKILNQINIDEQKFQENAFKDLYMKYNFNNESDINNQWICEEHKDKIYYVDLNQSNVVPSRVACMKCVPQYFTQYTTLDTLKKLWENRSLEIQSSINKNDKFINKQIGKAIESLLQVKDQICQLIDGCIEKINLIKQNQNWIFKENRFLLKKDWQYLDKKDIISIANILSNQKPEKTLIKEIESQCMQQLLFIQVDVESSYEKIQSIIRDQKSIFREYFHTDVNQQILQPSEQLIKSVQIEDSKEKEQITIGYQNLLNFELLQDNSYKEEQIYAIAFNEEVTTMIVGKSKLITVFKFDGKLTSIQGLNQHKDKVTCLHFMKKSSTFVSGAGDNLILIWELNNEQIWKLQQQLDGHSGAICCLVLSKNENLMITGATDKKIMIWKKLNQWIHFQTLFHHENEINSLSLNQAENQLISCARQENKIIISTKHSKDLLWLEARYIQTTQWGLSLSFINDSLFTFQPYNQKVLELYQRKEGSEEFLKSGQIELKKNSESMKVSSQIYIKSKSVFFHQNGSQIFIFRITDDFEFIIKSFEFQSDRIVGCITPDCKYLVTWDDQSEQLQIRKLLKQI